MGILEKGSIPVSVNDLHTSGKVDSLLLKTNHLAGKVFSMSTLKKQAINNPAKYIMAL